MPGLQLKLPMSFTDTSLPKLATLLASDSFTRADGGLGSSETGLGAPALPWAVDVNIAVAANKWRASGQSTSRSSRVNVGVTDMKVTAKVVTLNGGVTARWLDGNNYYRLDIEDDKMVAYRTAGGVLATMGGPYPRPAIGDTIALQVSGATVTAYINDVLVGAKVDPSPLPSGTSAGLRSAATATTEFDDFLVTNF